MKPKLFTIFTLAVASAISAQAQTSYTGTSSTGLWFSNRWNNTTDAAPYTSAFTANNAASFAAGTYTFTGGGTGSVGNVTLADGASVTFSSASGTWGTGGNVRTLTIGSGSILDLNTNAISTTAGTGFIKSGAGVLAIAGGTYSGGFTLNAGTVILRGVNGMGDGGLLTLNGGTIAGSATRNLAGKYDSGIVVGGDIQFGELAANVSIASDSANLTFDNTVSLGAATRTFTQGNNGTNTFSGVFSNSGSGGLTFAANASTTGRFDITNTANTFTGNINVNGGEVRFTADGSLGDAANDIIIDGGRFATASATTYALGGGRDVFVGDGAGTAISVTTSGTLTIDSAIANKTSETGSWSKQGAGILELGGTSTYTGSTAVQQGTLRLTTGNNRLPTGTLVSLGQASSTNLGTLDLNGRNQQLTGLVSTTGTNATTNNNTVTSATAATLTLDGSGSHSFGDGTNANSGVITGSISLVKNGAGTQTLGDINTYTGTTTVNNGILALSGTGTLGSGNITLGGGTLSIAGISTSTYSIGIGQSLLGSGDINSTDKTLEILGTLAPGSSPGTIDLTGNLALGSGSTSIFEITGLTPGDFDQVNVSGLLTLGGTLNLITTGSYSNGDFVQLFDAGSFAGTFASITGTDLGGGLSWNTSALSTSGIITVVPEPTAAFIGSLGLLGLLRRRR